MPIIIKTLKALRKLLKQFSFLFIVHSFHFSEKNSIFVRLLRLRFYLILDQFHFELTGGFPPSGTKMSASESRQYLLPVGAGPSSKT